MADRRYSDNRYSDNRYSGRRYSNYIDGNAAKVLAMPERDYERRQRDYSEPERRGKREPVKRTRKKVSVMSSLVTIASIGLALYMCISYIMLYSDVLALENEIKDINSSVAELAADNEEAYESIESSVDLQQVYKTAVKKLGMVHATEEQIYTYSNKKNDRVIQYSEIPE